MCYSVSFVRYSRSGRSVCPKKLCHLRGSPQKLGSNLGPISPKHYQKSRSKKYAEPRQINEIANQNLATNQKVGSSSPPGRAIFSLIHLQLKGPVRAPLQT